MSGILGGVAGSNRQPKNDNQTDQSGGGHDGFQPPGQISEVQAERNSDDHKGNGPPAYSGGAKQAAASSRNGVVGKPGNTSPNPASVVNTSPVAIRSERRAACQAGVRGVWGRFPACRLSDAFRSCCEGTAGLSATVYPGNRPPSVRPGLPLWAVNFNDFRDVGSVDKATSPVRVAGVKVGDLSVLP